MQARTSFGATQALLPLSITHPPQSTDSSSKQIAHRYILSGSRPSLRTLARTPGYRSSERTTCTACKCRRSSVAAVSHTTEGGGEAMHRAHSVAVVGGGLSGLACASKLLELLPQATATVFDMGMRGPGGRASTRRQDGLEFDHGLQFMRFEESALQHDARGGKDLRRQLSLWSQAGAASRWSGRFGSLDAATASFVSRKDVQAGMQIPGSFCSFLSPGELWVGTPSSDALCKSLADAQPKRLSHSWATKVTDLHERPGGGWSLRGVQRGGGAPEGTVDLGSYEAVVLSDAMAGNPGSPGFIRTEAEGLQQLLSSMGAATAAPRISLMAAFPGGALNAPFDAAAVASSDILEWACCNSAKPARRSDGEECWVAVSTEAFAQRALASLPLRINGAYNPATPAAMAAITEEMAEALTALLAPFVARPGKPLKATHTAAQRWGSCLYPSQDVASSRGEPKQLLAAAECGTVVCTGDWLAGSEAQAVLRHAHATARRLAGTLASGLS